MLNSLLLSKRKLWLYPLVILIFFFRLIFFSPNFSEGQRVKISSRVASEPRVTFGKQTFRLLGLKISLPIFPEIHYGDYIVIEGTVQGRELVNPKLKDLKVSNSILINLRKKLIFIYNQSLPSPHSSLVAGIVIGAKSNLGSFYNKLINTGTSHVVVASGMNVTMFSGFILSLSLNFIRRKWAIFVTLSFILIYCFLTGFEAPIVRAALMSFFALVAQVFGRLANTLRIFLLTGTLMIFIRPDWLGDIGFILSFTTTFSMILFESKISRLIHFVPNVLRESLSTSLSAQLIASPIIFFSFGKINLLSPLINALVLWTVAPIMVLGGIGGLVGIVSEQLGNFILLLTYPLTHWFIFVVNFFG